MIACDARTLLGIVLVGMLVTGCARSIKNAPAAEAASSAEETITLLYDVRVLIDRSSVPDFDVVYDELGWPSLDTSRSTHATRHALVQAIREVVMQIDPLSWRRHNGAGAIDEDSGQLIVTQTRDNHAKIARLLEHARAMRSLQVSVQSYVIKGDDVWSQLEQSGRQWIDMDESTQMLPLSAEQVRPLVEGRKQDGEGFTYLTAPRVTMFNGQRAHIRVATETEYVASYAPADVAFEGRKFEPVTKTVHSGVAIDCRATVSDDQKYVTLTLCPRLSTLRDMKSVPWPDAPADRKDLQVQVPHLTMAGVDVTVSMPDHGWVLVRTVPKHLPADADAPPAEPVLFAFGATVLDPRE